MTESTVNEHALDCEWHLDQYPWECSCGLLAREGHWRRIDLDGVIVEGPDS